MQVAEIATAQGGGDRSTGGTEPEFMGEITQQRREWNQQVPNAGFY
jgi:hypothetical protein